MNTKTLLTVKIDKNSKQAAQEIAQEIGIPLGTLVNTFIKQFIRTKEVTLSSEYIPTPKLLAILEENERELASGKLKPMTLDELFKNLRS